MEKPQFHSVVRCQCKIGKLFCTLAGILFCLWLCVPITRAQPLTRHFQVDSDRTPVRDEFDLLPIDTLFYIDNQGLTRVHAQVNSIRFTLTTEPEEVERGDNTYLIPRDGEVTMNIAPAMHSGEGNTMQLQSIGPEGSTADVVVADLLLTDRVHFVLDVEPLPEAFTLLKNAPNPFSQQTTITYKIPRDRRTGLAVRLTIYDALGRRIRTLVDARRFPGDFTVVWDGRDAQGRRVASGTYFCQLVAGPFRETIRMVLID